VIAGINEAGSPDEYLGAHCFGKAYYDMDGSAHERYDVLIVKGAVFVLRPDGIIAIRVGLKAADKLTTYFGRLVLKKDARFGKQHGNENENEMETGVVSLEKTHDSMEKRG